MPLRTFVAVAIATAAPLVPAVGHASPRPEAASRGEAAATLKQDLRKLWTDHVVWTRDYIISAVADQPDAQSAASRLMKNQEDIGKAIAQFYGEAAGQQLTTLLKEHISIAVDLIKAAKTGDIAGQQQADTKWQQNAVQIADLLSKANPNWPRTTLGDLMKEHLSTTTAEVVARLNKNWDADVQAFDAVYEHILKMSDALADGIIKQFPDKFGM
jgi:type VI protein secretion system component VasK